jgi:hypothetical protein
VRIRWKGVAAAAVAMAIVGGSLAVGGISLALAQAQDDSGGVGPGTYVGPGGKQLVIDPPPELPPNPQQRRSAQLAPLPGPGGDAAEVAAAPPALHSLPGALRTIYLDFDGATITDTAWNDNTALNTPASFDSAPFDADGDPATFSPDEQATIRSIWERVAQDFAPFQVDVTTEEPDPTALHRTDLADETYGVTVLITDGPAVADSCACGGLAWVDVFDAVGDAHDHFQPAFVFSQPLAHQAKLVAEAASHEAGHNLGLVHDATTTAAYYRGQGAWAPIMGDGYYRPIVQWSKGEYANASNNGTAVLQDDLAVMAGNGIPVKADDHGGDPATATVLAAGGSGPWAAEGLITTRADQDWFRLDLAAASTVQVHAAPTAVGGGPAISPDLDVRLSIRNAAGEVVFADPLSAQVDNDTASGLDATITRNLAAGTWYVVVDGVGALDPVTSGYSDYGSLGTYRLDATATPVPASAGRVPFDLTGDGAADEGVYRPGNATWSFNSTGQIPQGGVVLPYSVPVAGQWDADPADDLATWNTVLGLWQIQGRSAVVFGLGVLGDVPVPADWNGDGLLDIAVYRAPTRQWLVKGGPTTTFGLKGDIPVPGQWDADPQADIAVYRPSTGEWIVQGQSQPSAVLGQAGDVPVPVDTDGDGRLEPAVWRPSEARWIVLGGPDLVLGTPGEGDIPVAAQWDGLPGDDLGTYRPSTGLWSTPAGSVVLGGAGYQPAQVPPWLRVPLGL